MLKGRRLVILGVITALIFAAPGRVRAETASWHSLCRELGDFAGLLTDYRNQGRNLHDAISVAFPTLHVTTDHVVASEVAEQVYATPGLDREQETAAIFTKCMTPAADQSRPQRQSIDRVTDPVAIPLQFGPNHIRRFASDGRDADITLAWQDEGNGRGRDVFLVTMQSIDGTGWRRIDLLPSDTSASGSLIADDPHRGDDTLRSLRFAWAKVDGQDATLLLVATRQEREYAAASATTYEVYRLIQVDGRDGFAPVERRNLPGAYCNADMALTVASGLPLRTSYRGPRDAEGGFTKDGCPLPEALTGR